MSPLYPRIPHVQSSLHLRFITLAPQAPREVPTIRSSHGIGDSSLGVMPGCRSLVSINNMCSYGSNAKVPKKDVTVVAQVLYKMLSRCWKSLSASTHGSFSQQQSCTGLSLSPRYPSSGPPALSRLAQSRLKPTPSCHGKPAQALVALAAPLSQVPLRSTPTGAGPTLPVGTPTASPETSGTPPLALMAPPARRTAPSTVPTTLVSFHSSS
jgi:hypothetical protein